MPMQAGIDNIPGVSLGFGWINFRSASTWNLFFLTNSIYYTAMIIGLIA
jgi:hypothetical protein